MTAKRSFPSLKNLHEDFRLLGRTPELHRTMMTVITPPPSEHPTLDTTTALTIMNLGVVFLHLSLPRLVTLSRTSTI